MTIRQALRLCMCCFGFHDWRVIHRHIDAEWNVATSHVCCNQCGVTVRKERAAYAY